MKKSVVKLFAAMFLAFCVLPAFGTSVSADTDLSSKDVWEDATYPLSENNTGVVIAEFEAVLLDGNPDIFIGYVDSSIEPTAFSQINAIIRFADDGTIDARNGGAFGADATVVYEPGKIYKVKFVVDIPAATYDVFVNGTQIASNYAFRTGSGAIDALGKILVLCFDEADNGKFMVRSHTVSSVTQEPVQEPVVPDSPKTSDSSILLLILIGIGSLFTAVVIFMKKNARAK